MRISELSRRSDVAVPTIKFYLREGLLPDGVLTSATQAQYDEAHVARLRLIRALVGPGGLSLAAVRQVIAAIEDPPAATHDLLGAALAAVAGQQPVRDHTQVHALLERWGWHADLEDCTRHDDLAAALAGLDDAGFEPPPGVLDAYAEHVTAIARREIEAVPTDSVATTVRYVVLGTVLLEPVMLALRRLAHQELSARRFRSAAP
jgi:DNA-binding transcriptional MerR regulator